MGHNYDYFTIKTIYVLINMICMIVMYKYGQKIAATKSNKVAWQFAAVIIAVYSVCLGLRFGRDIDYNALYYFYNDIGKDITSTNYEPSFKIICWSLYNLGVPFSGFIWFCSIMMVSSFLHLCINHYKELAPLACLIFMWEAHDMENLIRFFLGFSFLLFSISFYKSSKYKKAVILALIACTTHVGMIITTGVVFLLSFLKKAIAPPIVIFSLLIISIFFAKVQIMEGLSPYLSFLSFNERTTAYVDSYENIVSGNFSSVGSLEKDFSLRTAIVLLLKYGLPIFIVPKLLKNKVVSALECNLFFIGIIQVSHVENLLR